MWRSVVAMHSCLCGAPGRRAARPRYALPLLHSAARDRQAIRRAGASTEPAAGLPCVDLLLAPPVKLVVVGAPVNEEVPIQARRRFTCKSAFFRVAGPGFEPGTP
jgi:hypothetical protein